jgi:hypothetical protein
MLPIILIPLPLASVVAGLVGSYAATKFIKHIEPQLDKAIRKEIEQREAFYSAKRYVTEKNVSDNTNTETNNLYPINLPYQGD